jgi:hypothetical protein
MRDGSELTLPPIIRRLPTLAPARIADDLKTKIYRCTDRRQNNRLSSCGMGGWVEQKQNFRRCRAGLIIFDSV